VVVSACPVGSSAENRILRRPASLSEFGKAGQCGQRAKLFCADRLAFLKSAVARCPGEKMSHLNFPVYAVAILMLAAASSGWIAGLLIAKRRFAAEREATFAAMGKMVSGWTETLQAARLEPASSFPDRDLRALIPIDPADSLRSALRDRAVVDWHGIALRLDDPIISPAKTGIDLADEIAGGMGNTFADWERVMSGSPVAEYRFDDTYRPFEQDAVPRTVRASIVALNRAEQVVA
jgi:hypothetical protein